MCFFILCVFFFVRMCYVVDFCYFVLLFVVCVGGVDVVFDVGDW